MRKGLPRTFCLLLLFTACSLRLCGEFLFAADVESRQLTHYLPQDQLEEIVRKEDWTEVPLAVKGGARAGDVVRVWAGGLIDRGDADQPGQNAGGPEGAAPGDAKAAFALSADAAQAYALLFKTESTGPTR